MIKYNIPAYNIYFGTIGNTLGVKYRYTKRFRDSNLANKEAKEAASSFYYKHEGKYGLPSYKQISEESKITGIDIIKLYEEHINDMCRWYVIPCEEDTVPSRKIRWQ